MDEKIGVVTDYLNRLGVAVVRLTDGDLHVGDEVRIAGKTTGLVQTVESLQIEHQAVTHAISGTEVAVDDPPPDPRGERWAGLKSFKQKGGAGRRHRM